MGMVSRVDAYQRRHRWAGLPLAVLYKFADDQGTYLAAQITYYGFVALFPLLLLLATILGYALHGSQHLQRQVLDSALAQFPVIGDQITANIRSFHGSTAGLVIGMLGCVYGGLGIVQAAQTMLNKVWGVPRNSRPNPLRSRLRSLLLLAAGGASVIVTTVLSALGAAAGSYGASLGGGVRALATAAAITLNVALFIAAFRILTASAVTIREIRAGAVAAAVVWQALQWAGALLLGHELKGATATYGLFALVLGLLAWIYLGAVTTVLCAEYNAVRAGQLWPRSLLTPFTDNAYLTPADQRAYTSYVKTERHKNFQNIDVSFGKPPNPNPPNQNPEHFTSAGDRSVTLGYHLQAALARDRLGEYQAQAAIAALHADARTTSETDWVQIVEWYDELLRLTGSPVVRLNRAVAVGEADGPQAGLAALADVDPDLPRYTAVAAYLHERAGHLERAAKLYAEASRTAASMPERDHLTREAARVRQLLHP